MNNIYQFSVVYSCDKFRVQFHHYNGRIKVYDNVSRSSIARLKYWLRDNHLEFKLTKGLFNSLGMAVVFTKGG